MISSCTCLIFKKNWPMETTASIMICAAASATGHTHDVYNTGRVCNLMEYEDICNLMEYKPITASIMCAHHDTCIRAS